MPDDVSHDCKIQIAVMIRLKLLLVHFLIIHFFIWSYFDDFSFDWLKHPIHHEPFTPGEAFYFE